MTASTSGSAVTASGGNINVIATANQTLNTTSVVLSGSIGFIAAGGVLARVAETINPNVTASNTGGSLTASGNLVNIHASFTGNVDPEAIAGALAITPVGGAISAVTANANIGGTTRAFSAGGTITATSRAQASQCPGSRSALAQSSPPPT